MRFLKDISDKNRKIDLIAITEKYELPFDEAKAVIEKSISGTLSGIFRQDVECILDGHGCEIYVFREKGVERLPLERLKKNILRAIKYGIVSALQRESTARGCEKLRFMTGRIVGGHVSAVFENHIFVELKIAGLNGGSDRLTVGICEKEHQTPKERGFYRPGDYLNFYVLNVGASSSDGVPALRVSLSRTSTGLTEGLLHAALVDRLLDTKIRCVKRSAGVASLVEAEGLIPQECIKAVSDELKERVIIHAQRK